MPAGRLLEAAGDRRPRGMIASAPGVTRTRDRTRLTERRRPRTPGPHGSGVRVLWLRAMRRSAAFGGALPQAGAVAEEGLAALLREVGAPLLSRGDAPHARRRRLAGAGGHRDAAAAPHASAAAPTARAAPAATGRAARRGATVVAGIDPPTARERRQPDDRQETPRGKAHATSWPQIGRSVAHALKLEPQPHEPLEFGLLNLNPAPWSPST